MLNKKAKKDKQFGNKLDISIVNSVTAVRFLGSFLILPVFQTFGGLAAAIFSGVFLFTDTIDGFLARKLKASTFFGSLFDGLTDKLFVGLALAILISINPIVFIPLILLELGIVATQNKKYKKGLNVKSNMIGKVKTWIMGLSLVGSFAVIDLLNIKSIFSYLSDASLSKVAGIRDFLAIFGITLPAIVAEILTLKSYQKELKEEKIEELPNEQIVEEKIESEEIIEPEEKLNTIKEEKEKLNNEKSKLGQLKIMKEKLFDPEYYSLHKDEPIRKLIKELSEK